jgi:hypothetical protein
MSRRCHPELYIPGAGECILCKSRVVKQPGLCFLLTEICSCQSCRSYSINKKQVAQYYQDLHRKYKIIVELFPMFNKKVIFCWG